MKLDEYMVQKIVDEALQIFSEGRPRIDDLEQFLRKLDLRFKPGDSSQSVLVDGEY